MSTSPPDRRKNTASLSGILREIQGAANFGDLRRLCETGGRMDAPGVVLAFPHFERQPTTAEIAGTPLDGSQQFAPDAESAMLREN